MSDIQRQQAHSSKILLIAGSLCALFGLFMFAQRQGLASFFFGAHFLFGIPLTGGDALKVNMMALSSVVTVLMGLVILAVGMVLFLKSAQPHRDTTATTPS
jgi:ABC-type uncharacterized transport system permease subunit